MVALSAGILRVYLVSTGTVRMVTVSTYSEGELHEFRHTRMLAMNTDALRVDVVKTGKVRKGCPDYRYLCG
jgi:hypothetical protein